MKDIFSDAAFNRKYNTRALRDTLQGILDSYLCVGEVSVWSHGLVQQKYQVPDTDIAVTHTIHTSRRPRPRTFWFPFGLPGGDQLSAGDITVSGTPFQTALGRAGFVAFLGDMAAKEASGKIDIVQLVPCSNRPDQRLAAGMLVRDLVDFCYERIPEASD